ncbi:MAG: hypothetical protein DWQ01_20935 [Planctomycetota bacterium]|nr:MAG: hypothetical protein DWQ01_20935 [Planctomycetota bacterium]
MPRPPLVGDPRLRLGNASRGGLLAKDVRPLLGFRNRLRLVAFRKPIAGLAWWLSPAPSVHSFGVKAPLRALCLNAEMRVIQVLELPPWRAMATPAGTAAALLQPAEPWLEVQPGDRLEWLQSQPRLEDRADWLHQEEAAELP